MGGYFLILGRTLEGKSLGLDGPKFGAPSMLISPTSSLIATAYTSSSPRLVASFRAGKYRSDGTEKLMALGKYPDFSLADARAD